MADIQQTSAQTDHAFILVRTKRRALFFKQMTK